MKKRFELKEGHELRGMMIKLYPTKEQVDKLVELECALRKVWNSAIRDSDVVMQARRAYAVKQGLVEPPPERPNYEELEKDQCAEAKKNYMAAIAEWGSRVHACTKDLPQCSFRPFREVLSHFGVKHDYQYFKKLGPKEVEIPTRLLQALSQSLFQKSERRKRRKRDTDPMPIRTRSGKCFEIGEFGTRGKEGRQFYNCRVKIAGLTIRGRLPGRLPAGRVLQGVSIRYEADGYWASIKVEVPIRALPEPEPGTIIGIDVGLNALAAFSDGRIVPNSRNKELSERIAGRQALGKPVGRLHLKAKRHTLHEIHNKVIKPLCKTETIKIEKLSADIGQRGSTMTSAMRTIASLLKERYGERVREVEPHYTSQDCSQCGHRSKETWSYDHGPIGYCPVCGHRENRDVNAARNIASRPPIAEAN